MAANPTDPGADSSADPTAVAEPDVTPDRAATGAVNPGGTLIVYGMNHRTAAQGLRDKLFLEIDEQPMLLSDIGAAGIGEAMILSTCDRVEVVAVCQDPEAANRSLMDLLVARSGLPASSFPDVGPS